MALLNKSILLSAISISLLAGCSSLMPNQHASSYKMEVRPVMTEYSLALSCVGNLIDNSNALPLTVYVRDIDDETVPYRFSERRLSKGGAWWFHTAIDKMQSDSVSSTIKSPSKKQIASSNYLVLNGAWTQDDVEVGVRGVEIGFDNLGRGILDKLGWSNRQQTSVIAGDFVSSMNNRVVHASAISLALNNSDNSYELRIDDGSRRFNLGLVNEVKEGPQFAQRRIAEAAALVHVARAFNVDYRSCMEKDQTNPQHYQKAMSEFMAFSAYEQKQRMQSVLFAAGYYSGAIDGKWGLQSEKALRLFLIEQGVAPSGQPSAQTYGMLIKYQPVAESTKVE